MGWSRFKPMARTDWASLPAPPAGVAPFGLGLGAEMWERVFFFFFLFSFFFVLRDTRINNTIFDFGCALSSI